MRTYLDFEKPLEELELKLEAIATQTQERDPVVECEVQVLQQQLNQRRQELIASLTPWQKCQLARHPERPYTLDYIKRLTEDFLELHGDRRFSDDPAIIGGFGTIDNHSVLIVGHQKGRGTKERIGRNFGQPHPEGYRKALRLMKLAERFDIPVVTLIDTPGAFPGSGAEERGQAEAIATNLLELSLLSVPVISIVIGEGGSGGALALSVADRLVMLEHAIYSVISPEGCAAILWESDKLTQEDFSRAASALKLTASDLLAFNVIDGIISEPLGGAHIDMDEAARLVKTYIVDTLRTLREIPKDVLLQERYKKITSMGVFSQDKDPAEIQEVGDSAV
ncbi:MAG: acetyl-CoA carboxylase carboxyltransferase subunit alpha [Nitrospirae bacterium]|uniref:acetyl-CoA carboxylase carboxyltransferase subunit alpha n=1 Tax=Candidatus Magnetobacterium casense TaxID=1455061 RepID=UPI00058DFFF6|nr:acetyl-CoA carboxylase carboxyltransferase subunit alpha [Candidatus Magnetobacterium casensis]MBF0338073.1 acetyl-CoA carboxylase carboxyltransferase subunit alpha [Nitrospirota bacterium]